MTAKHNHRERYAVAAVASLSAGLLATALAVYTQANPFAFTSATSVTTASRGLTSDEAIEETATSAESEFLPRVEAKAFPELAALHLPRMTIVGGHSHTRGAMAKLDSNPACVPYWRSLDAGPVGRHVLVTCPGARNVPPEPKETLSNNRELKLPSIAMFNKEVPPLELDSDLAPSAKRAERAGHRVDLLLSRRADAVPESTAGGARDVAELPLQNPLTWAPTRGNS
jgi:hypothetical protein